MKNVGKLIEEYDHSVIKRTERLVNIVRKTSVVKMSSEDKKFRHVKDSCGLRKKDESDTHSDLLNGSKYFTIICAKCGEEAGKCIIRTTFKLASLIPNSSSLLPLFLFDSHSLNRHKAIDS